MATAIAMLLFLVVGQVTDRYDRRFILLACQIIEAIAAATGDRFNLMLLDVNLPDATGWDALRELAVQANKKGTGARALRDR